MHQKNAFGQKNSNFMHGFKSAILAIFHFFQNESLKAWNAKLEAGIFLAV